jgi:hypothetical protein
MRRESSKAESEASDARLERWRQDAQEVVLQVREKLISQMTEEVLSKRDAILDGSAQDGVFSFEFQEIEDRYSARLHALNSLLENLECRQPPRVAHKVEVLVSTQKTLQTDLNDLVARYDEWDLVDIDVSCLDGSRLLVVVAFSADDYGE